MKKYLLTMSLLSLVFSCGPSETQKTDMQNLVAEWKDTSVRAVELSQSIGDKLYLLETKKSEAESPEMMKITFEGDQTQCEAEYKKMQLAVESFVQTWQEKSKSVDELTNSMVVGRWTATDQKALETLELEVKQREVDIAQWEQDLKTLNEKCELTSEMLVIQEQES